MPNYLQAITVIVREVAPKRFLTVIPPIRYRMQCILPRYYKREINKGRQERRKGKESLITSSYTSTILFDRLVYILKRSFAASLDYVKSKSEITDLDGGILGGEKNASQVNRLLTRIQQRFEEFLDTTCQVADKAIMSCILSFVFFCLLLSSLFPLVSSSSFSLMFFI